MGHFTFDPKLCNQFLNEWLIEYNFVRLHHSLDKLPPIEHAQKYHQLLPMYSSRTKTLDKKIKTANLNLELDLQKEEK